MTGIRAELAVENPPNCPVARAAETADSPVREVRWAETESATVEQFELAGDLPDADYAAVFARGDRTVYEFDRPSTPPCFCEVVEASLGPVTDVAARDGTLHVMLHAGEVARLRELVVELAERFDDVRLEYLARTGDDAGGEIVPLDVATLTDRQREVLETAFAMGYFEYPRGANATAVADSLGIDPSTFSEHLAVAQEKLLGQLLDRR